MDVAEAKALLKTAGNEEPVFLQPSVLDKVLLDDIPDQVMIEVGTFKDGAMHLDWSGRPYKDQDQIKGEADYTWTRKYWYLPVGLEHYLRSPGIIRVSIDTAQFLRLSNLKIYEEI